MRFSDRNIFALLNFAVNPQHQEISIDPVMRRGDKVGKTEVKRWERRRWKDGKDGGEKMEKTEVTRWERRKWKDGKDGVDKVEKTEWKDWKDWVDKVGRIEVNSLEIRDDKAGKKSRKIGWQD